MKRALTIFSCLSTVLLAGVSPSFAQDQAPNAAPNPASVATPAQDNPNTQNTDRDEDAWRKSRKKRDTSDPLGVFKNTSIYGPRHQQRPQSKIDQLPEASRRHLMKQRAKIIAEMEFGKDGKIKNKAYTPSEAAKKDTDLADKEKEAWDVIVTDLEAGNSQGKPGTGKNKVTVVGRGGNSSGSPLRGGSTASAAEILAMLKGMKAQGIRPDGRGTHAGMPGPLGQAPTGHSGIEGRSSQQNKTLQQGQTGQVGTQEQDGQQSQSGAASHQAQQGQSSGQSFGQGNSQSVGQNGQGQNGQGQNGQEQTPAQQAAANTAMRGGSTASASQILNQIQRAGAAQGQSQGQMNQNQANPSQVNPSQANQGQGSEGQASQQQMVQGQTPFQNQTAKQAQSQTKSEAQNQALAQAQAQAQASGAAKTAARKQPQSLFGTSSQQTGDETPECQISSASDWLKHASDGQSGCN